MSVSVITLDDGTLVNLVALPAYPGLASAEFTGFDGIGFVNSPFTGQAQSQQWHGGDMWSGKATLPMMTQANSDNWLAFLEELRGMSNAFQMGDPQQTNIRGSGAGRPRIDNAAAGGNPPGSLTLSTRGWTPNAVGVLLAGDYIQLGYRLYRALDDITADASGNAVIPIWPSLREHPFDDGTPGGWVNANGRVTMFRSRPLEADTQGLVWYNFSAPTVAMPADAAITGIYPVMICSLVSDQAFSQIAYSTPLDPNNNFGTPFTAPFTPPSSPGSGGYSSTEFYDLHNPPPPGVGIGTDLSVLATQAVHALLQQSLFLDGLSDVINITAVGCAVYYTSATPITDPQMPPPFAVPAGSGVVWSLPLSIVGTGATGTGTAFGSPARLNGLLQLNDTKNLWRLATNKRDWTTEFERLTAPSFPFQEYR